VQVNSWEEKRQITKEIIPMKLTWHGHSAFRIEAGAAKILIDPFLSDNPSWDKGWSGYLAGKNSTQGGDR
jgi:L-ascorbate metabolism protein UlaG (beta-lactamase superfamily)